MEHVSQHTCEMSLNDDEQKGQPDSDGAAAQRLQVPDAQADAACRECEQTSRRDFGYSPRSPIDSPRSHPASFPI